METLGERVRAIRENRGLTQAALAEKARMERTDINRVENGTLNLGPDRLGRVADALEVSVLELRPEAEPDERGTSLLGHLEELAENQAQMLQNQIEGTAAIANRLAELQSSLDSLAEALRSDPKRSRRTR